MNAYSKEVFWRYWIIMKIQRSFVCVVRGFVHTATWREYRDTNEYIYICAYVNVNT